ncbi:hypothetical protein [Streptomyces sp. NPDC048637]|uniref:hypothetical protein n=1 Tax=Streptomyces sp. NPDC048637 TaxID=3155636 RepID=UPI00341A0BE7
MREQGKAVARCGRLLLFTALIAGVVPLHTAGRPTGRHGGHAPLSVWTLALLVLLGAGLLTGCRATGLLTALRTRLLRGLWPISVPPRHKLPNRLSVLRV